MNKPNPKVDDFLAEADRWQAEMGKLRKIARTFPVLTEELKWGKPCYALNGNNVVLIHGFKEYCALLFMKGVLFKDPKGILIQQTEHVQAGRQIRFTSLKEITGMESTLKAYIQQAIDVEKAGLQVVYKKEPEPMPEELQTKLDAQPALKTAFQALTPGRQRAYILFFSAAKQSKTREARIEKCAPMILKGKGLND